MIDFDRCLDCEKSLPGIRFFLLDGALCHDCFGKRQAAFRKRMTREHRSWARQRFERMKTRAQQQVRP